MAKMKKGKYVIGQGKDCSTTSLEPWRKNCLEDEAWKSMFEIVSKVEGGFLLIKKGEYFSYNMVLYRHRGHAERGARAAYNKINKEFEKFLLK